MSLPPSVLQATSSLGDLLDLRAFAEVCQSFVELYRVGDVHFVVDGHHRVSVGRATGMVYIQAEVREYHLKPATPTFSELVSQARRASRAEPAVEAACPCAGLGREA